MSSNVIEWAREKCKELAEPETQSAWQLHKCKWKVDLHEGMLVRGLHSRWEETQHDWTGHDYGYATFTEDLYTLLSKQDDYWLALTPKDGVQSIHEHKFLSIDTIPFWQSAEEKKKQHDDWYERYVGDMAYDCFPGLDYEPASDIDWDNQRSVPGLDYEEAS
jgi:hypothetical protein